MSEMKQKILEYIGQLENLPSLPDTTVHLTEILSRPEQSIGDAVKLIKHDPGLTARLLRMANSVLFSPRQEITSVERAVIHLGLTSIKQVALAHGVIHSFAVKAPPEYLQDFWKRSLGVAFIAGTLLNFVRPAPGVFLPDAADCFTAGLVHDLGILILLQGFPREMLQLIHESQKEQRPLPAVERAAWGITHQEAGGLLCEKWNLPSGIRAAAQYHHEPERAGGPQRPLAQLVHLANYICINRGLGGRSDVNPEQISHGAWHDLGLSLENIPEVIEQAENAARAAEVLL